MRVLIPGANGFIGNWLVRRILKETDWHVVGMDIVQNNLDDPIDACLDHKRLTFHLCDLTKDMALVEKEIQAADVVIPLAAIANPAIYIKDPLRVFHLDFEVNLDIIKKVVTHKKRLIFPSTSEVYGMCPDESFNEETSTLVLGPTQKSRWIYSCAKQMLDRVIHAYGEYQGLQYTLFRPFNWMGPRLDNIKATQEGASRAITQFMSNAINGRPIQLVNGGLQRRAFIYIEDAIDAMMKILHNENGAADQQIFNIGNPANDFSIKEIAEMIKEEVSAFPPSRQHAGQTVIEVMPEAEYFGEGYQDVSRRVPSVEKAKDLLGWVPKTDLKTAIKKTLSFYLGERA